VRRIDERLDRRRSFISILSEGGHYRTLSETLGQRYRARGTLGLGSIAIPTRQYRKFHIGGNYFSTQILIVGWQKDSIAPTINLNLAALQTALEAILFEVHNGELSS